MKKYVIPALGGRAVDLLLAMRFQSSPTGVSNQANDKAVVSQRQKPANNQVLKVGDESTLAEEMLYPAEHKGHSAVEVIEDMQGKRQDRKEQSSLVEKESIKPVIQ